jgi:hypothetical protein
MRDWMKFGLHNLLPYELVQRFNIVQLFWLLMMSVGGISLKVQSTAVIYHIRE